MTRIFYDEDVPAGALEGETVAVIGYGTQGRAQALTLRDSGVTVVVGNRLDQYSHQAKQDGFAVHDIPEAVSRATIINFLIPDELQPRVFNEQIAPHLAPGAAIVFAHGFAVHYNLLELPQRLDSLLLAPRMPGVYLRGRYLDGWGVPAFVAVGRDTTGKAWTRLLGLAGALGITRCAAIETTFAEETELDLFSEQAIQPLFFRALTTAFETLVEAGFPPELALMDLHGSGELSQLLEGAAEEGLFDMIESYATPACKVGIAREWDQAAGPPEELRDRMRARLRQIREGGFARYLVEEEGKGYPALDAWREKRPESMQKAERDLRRWLRGPTGSRYA